jgi:hypothetical protein
LVNFKCKKKESFSVNSRSIINYPISKIQKRVGRTELTKIKIGKREII